jgi:hypothetical protein
MCEGLMQNTSRREIFILMKNCSDNRIIRGKLFLRAASVYVASVLLHSLRQFNVNYVVN